MDVSDEIRKMIMTNEDASVLTRAARRNGMRNLREDGWRMIRSGMTTVEEVMRVTQDIDEEAKSDAETRRRGGKTQRNAKREYPTLLLRCALRVFLCVSASPRQISVPVWSPTTNGLHFSSSAP